MAVPVLDLLHRKLCHVGNPGPAQLGGGPRRGVFEVDGVAEPVQRLAPAAGDVLLRPAQGGEAPVAEVGDDAVADPALARSVPLPPDVAGAGELQRGLVGVVEGEGQERVPVRVDELSVPDPERRHSSPRKKSR